MKRPLKNDESQAAQNDGAAARLGLAVVHSPAEDVLRDLKAAREATSLTFIDASARRGINQPALSRLENGHTPNRTLDTLWRDGVALGRRLVLREEDVRETRWRHPKDHERGSIRRT